MGNKLSVNPDALIAAAAILKEAESNINSALGSINNIGVSAIIAPGTSASGKMTAIKTKTSDILSSEITLLSDLSEILKSNGETLKEANNVDSGVPIGAELAENERQKGEAHLKELEDQRKKKQSNYNSTGGGISSYSSSSQTANNSAPSNLASGIIGLPAMIINPSEREVNTPIQTTIDVRTESYQKLESLLKKGSITSETTALYDTLKTLGKGDEADSLLKKYGYVAGKDANGNTVISKIKSETTKTDSTKVPSNSDTDKKDNDSDNDKKNTDSDDEVVAPEVKPADNNQANDSSKNSYTTVDRKEYSSGNRKDISGNTDASTTQNTETKPETSNDTNTIKDNSNKVLDSKNKTNVINITDDSTSDSKKSSGMGAAVPIGLGAIAAGAAAVAGVRYVKNRHEGQEEYDEDYDDEDNKLDDGNNQYVDSAQYSNENDYTSDDYLGPAGSTYTDVDNNDVEDNYVDPEELETDSDDSDFSNDKVLEQLNFDGQ